MLSCLGMYSILKKMLVVSLLDSMSELVHPIVPLPLFLLRMSVLPTLASYVAQSQDYLYRPECLTSQRHFKVGKPILRFFFGPSQGVVLEQCFEISLLSLCAGQSLQLLFPLRRLLRDACVQLSGRARERRAELCGEDSGWAWAGRLHAARRRGCR